MRDAWRNDRASLRERLEIAAITVNGEGMIELFISMK